MILISVWELTRTAHNVDISSMTLNLSSLHPLPSFKAMSTFQIFITTAPHSQYQNLSWSAWTAITKYHRQCGLDSRNVFSHSSGDERSVAGMLHDGFLVRDLFLVCRQRHLLAVCLQGISLVRVHGERESKLSGVSSEKGTILIRPPTDQLPPQSPISKYYNNGGWGFNIWI